MRKYNKFIGFSMVTCAMCLGLLVGCQNNDTTKEESVAEKEQTQNMVVKTDYSGYKHKEYEMEIFTASDDVKEFIPSKSYGEVFPYAAGTLYNEIDYKIGNYYGLIDSNGKILSAPIYQDVIPAGYYDSENNWVDLPFLVLVKQVGMNIDYDGIDVPFEDSICILVNRDGSLATDFAFNKYACGDFGIVLLANEYIDEINNNTISLDEYYNKCDNYNKFQVISKEGDVVLTDADCKFSDELIGEGYLGMSYMNGNGLFGIQLTDGVQLMDMKGNKIGGLFYEIESFENGYAVVRDEEWLGGIINTKGDMAIEPEWWESIEYGHGGYALCYNEVDDTEYDEDSDDYDDIEYQGHIEYAVYELGKGKIAEGEAENVTLTNYGYIVENEEKEQWYDFNGNKLYEIEVAKENENEYDYEEAMFCSSFPIVISENMMKSTITNIENGKQITVDGDAYGDRTWIDNKGKKYLIVECDVYDVYGDDDIYKNILFSEELDQIIEARSIEEIADKVTGEKYLSVYDGKEWILYDGNLKELMKSKVEISDVINGQVLAIDKACCIYYHLDGTKWFYKKMNDSYAD